MKSTLLIFFSLITFHLYAQQPFQIIDDPTNTGLDISNHSETIAEEEAQIKLEQAEEQVQKSFQEKFAEYQKKLNEASDYVKNSREMVEATEYMYSSTEKIAKIIDDISSNPNLTYNEVIHSIESINSYMGKMFSAFEDIQELAGIFGQKSNMRDAQRLKKMQQKNRELKHLMSQINSIESSVKTKNNYYMLDLEKTAINCLIFNF